MLNQVCYRVDDSTSSHQVSFGRAYADRAECSSNISWHQTLGPTLTKPSTFSGTVLNLSLVNFNGFSYFLRTTLVVSHKRIK